MEVTESLISSLNTWSKTTEAYFKNLSNKYNNLMINNLNTKNPNIKRYRVVIQFEVQFIGKAIRIHYNACLSNPDAPEDSFNHVRRCDEISFENATLDTLEHLVDEYEAWTARSVLDFIS